MRIVVLGSRGMLGHVLTKFLEKNTKHEIFGVSKKYELDGVYFSDLTSPEAIQSIKQNINPDMIINCIGMLVKDSQDNQRKAVYVNSYFPHMLSEFFKDKKIIHISTDCVFSGNKGDYSISDVKDGTGVYAQTKSLGELNNKKDLTIRTSIIGPEIKDNGSGLFHWFMKQTGNANGYDKCFWNGLTTLELSKFIAYCITSEMTGLIQIGTQSKISKFDLLKLIAKVYNKEIYISRSSGLVQDKSIVSSICDYVPPSYEEQLVELRDIYPELIK